LAKSNEPFHGIHTEINSGIWLVTLEGAPEDSEFSEFLEKTADWLDGFRKEGRRIALVVDPSLLTRFDAPMRTAYGEWRKVNMALIRETCTRAAYIAEDAVWRGVLTAIFWVAKPAIPVQTFSDTQKAKLWISKKDDLP